MKQKQASPTFSARLDNADIERLAELARRLQLSKVDALRLAIRAGHADPERLTDPLP